MRHDLRKIRFIFKQSSKKQSIKQKCKQAVFLFNDINRDDKYIRDHLFITCNTVIGACFSDLLAKNIAIRIFGCRLQQLNDWIFCQAIRYQIKFFFQSTFLWTSCIRDNSTYQSDSKTLRKCHLLHESQLDVALQNNCKAEVSEGRKFRA